MNFTTEIQQYIQSVTTHISDQTKELEALQRHHETVNAKITAIKTATETYQRKHEATLQDITDKKQLITTWQHSIAEHETQLKANETLVANYTAIEKNQRLLEQSLLQLDTKRAEISQNIHDIHQKYPFMEATVQRRLQTELDEKLKELTTIMQQIRQFTLLEQQLNVIVKLFLDLLASFGWRTDPKADEQKKLALITEEITQITDSLNEFAHIRETLDTLTSEHDEVIQKKQEIQHQQQALSDLDRTKKAISESKQTIKQLIKKITETTEQCKILEKKIHDPGYQKQIAPLEGLKAEAARTSRKIQEKTAVLELINQPVHIAHRQEFVTRLLETVTKRAEYLDLKQGTRNTFFKQNSVDPNNIANHSAYTRLLHAIQIYAKTMPSHYQEPRILSAISHKLLSWQISEEIQHQTLSFAERQTAHAAFLAEIQDLIAELPIDNPLKGAQHFITAMTTPQPPSSEQQTQRNVTSQRSSGKGNRK